MRNSRLAFCAASLAVMASGSAYAAGNTAANSATANLTVEVTVNASCTINTSPVSFGSYNPAAPAATFVSGSVTVACVKGTIPKIGLSGGSNPGATAGERAMLNAGTNELLTYFLYKPELNSPNSCSTNETVIWGATGDDRLLPAATTSVAASTYSICGKIPAQQDVSAGTYQDTVIATVEF